MSSQNLVQFSPPISEIMGRLFRPVKLAKLTMRQKYISTESYAELKTWTQALDPPLPHFMG